MSDQNNYPFMQFAPANPTQAFGQGYGIGQAFQANQQAADAKIAAQRQAEQYQQLYARAMSPTSTKQDWDALIINTPPDQVPAVKVAYEQRVSDQEAQLAAMNKEAITNAYGNLQDSGGSIETYNELLSLIPPDQLETAKEAFNALSLDEQTNVVKETVQVISMIRSGNSKMAAEAVQSWADAERAEGNEQDALYHEQMVKQILAGNESASIVEQNLAVGLGMAGAIGEDVLDPLFKTKDAVRADLALSYEKKKLELSEDRFGLEKKQFAEEQTQNVIENELNRDKFTEEQLMNEENLRLDRIASNRQLYEVAAKYPFASDEARNQAARIAADYGDETAEKIIKLSGLVSSLDGMSPKDIVDAYLPIGS